LLQINVGRYLPANNNQNENTFDEDIARDVKRGQMLEVEAEAKFNRPSTRTKLKRPNRTLFHNEIYAIKHGAIINAIISLIIGHSECILKSQSKYYF